MGPLPWFRNNFINFWRPDGSFSGISEMERFQGRLGGFQKL
jgi:hypothetical protein